MEDYTIIITVLFTLYFLGTTTLLSTITKRLHFPYTVALLIAGFITHYATTYFGLNVSASLSPKLIFYVLLPLLLFESALKLNWHQFKIQFKTITFMATFGLLVSMFVIGVGLTYLIGFPFETALLFGALISATDPIAVIALFKQLGAPSRLRLIAEGESMFNDAAAVIMFRIMLSFAVAAHISIDPTPLLTDFSSFVYVFVASLLFGAFLAYITSYFIAKVENDLIVETTLTVALSIGVFVIAEHYLHLSGVIATVAAGLILGNIGKTKFSSGVVHFINEFWEYISFIVISLIFFFAAYGINISVLAAKWWMILIVYAVVLVARAISTYLTFFITNNVPLLNKEPNVPLSWQHVINWGGLRGVIPLVLIYELPEGMPYRDEIILFTLGTFLLSLFVNGTTVEWLVKHLGLHLLPEEETILQEEIDILRVLRAKEEIKKLPKTLYDKEIINNLQKEYDEKEQQLREKLLSHINEDSLYRSLKLQALVIERQVVNSLFDDNVIAENILFDYEAELDLLRDSIAYPSINPNASTTRVRDRSTDVSFRDKVHLLRLAVAHFRFLKYIFGSNAANIIIERATLLNARIIAARTVLKYLHDIKICLHGNEMPLKVLDKVKQEYLEFKATSKEELTRIVQDYPEVMAKHQLHEATMLINAKKTKSLNIHSQLNPSTL